MSIEAMVVFIADFIEPNRKDPDRQKIETIHLQD